MKELLVNDSIFAFHDSPQTDDRKLPAVILVHGGGGHAYREWVEQWNSYGYAAIAPDMEGYASEDNKWVHRYGPVNDFMKRPDLPEEEQWMHSAISIVNQCYDYLKSLPYVDADRIGIMGISWGGVVTSLAIAERKYAFAISVYGSGYLRYGKSEIDVTFRDMVRNESWRSENTFDRHSTPVLWMGWNDDNWFSPYPISRSYAHTLHNNPDCRLSIKNMMLHGHKPPWIAPEPLIFADSIIRKTDKLASITDDNGAYRVWCPYKINSVRLYYLMQPEVFMNFDKYPQIRAKHFRKEFFSSIETEIVDDMIIPVHNDTMAAWYYELRYEIDGKEAVATSVMNRKDWF